MLPALTGSLVRAAGQVLPHHVPAAAQGVAPLGRLDGATRLQLAISLPLRNQPDLTNLLHDLYDPASTNYHHYLTSAEFADRFGPTESDYRAVKDFATARGLTITREHSNRTLLDLAGPASNVETAFHLKLHSFKHPREARTFFAPDADPTLDLAVPVLTVSGLDNFELPHPAGLVRPQANAQPQATPNGGTGEYGTFLGADFRKAYLPGAPTSLNGAGQSVGLLEFDGYYSNDITMYESQAGLTNVPVTNVYLDSYNGAAGGNNLEVALDIEMCIAMAPGLNSVIVYEGTIPNDILNQMAIDNQAKQLSSSWTWSGYPDTPPMEQIFQQYAAQGQTYFNASGDSGAYTGAIQTPADDTNIVIVGGTMLNTDNSGNYLSEQAWSWFPSQSNAGSGGISQINTIPAWQQGISMSLNGGSTTFRNIPDVALTAANIYVVADNGTAEPGVGGTSAATPLWAGFTALVNQTAVAARHPTVGYLNPALYAIGKGAGYGYDFHDITVGNNTNASSPTQFYAQPGYDLCTGWGTPTGTNMINALALGVPIVVPSGSVLTAETCLPTNGAIDPGETVTLNFKLADIGSAPTSSLVATLQANGGIVSPSGPQTYGALTASGSAIGKPFTFAANGACGSNLTATLQLQDGSNNLGTVNFILQLGAITPATNFTQNFDGVTAPALPTGWTTDVSGSVPAWVTSSSARDTLPNAAFVSDSRHAGVTELVSPSIPITLSSAQLSFRHSYNTDSGFDGGVLEIQIGGGAFEDIISAGGSFASNGYTQTLGSGSGNPIAGRLAWSGNSGGFVTTLVNLPAAAAGQNIVLKWRFATDSSFSGVGWYVDTISIRDGTYSCCTGSADLGLSQVVSTNLAIVGQNLVYTLTLTNAGPSTAAGVIVTNSLPAGVSLVSGSPAYTLAGGSVVWGIGQLTANTSTNLTLTVTPSAPGSITNIATVWSTSFDANSANSTTTLVTPVDAPPVISAPPTNATVIVGGNANFSVTATGTPGHQWFFQGTNPVGGNSPVLMLSNVQLSQAGAYLVVISNAVGITSSIPVTLTVLAPPVIIAQPTNQIVTAGASVSFSVAAVGTPAPGYQWLLNGTNPVASGSQLNLSNVQPSQMGYYMAVVTNAVGTTNSTTVHLTVLVSPTVASIALTGTNVAVSFQSISGLNYLLEFKDGFVGTNWTSILPGTPGNGGTLTLYDTNGISSQRLYRINCN
jgi:uncharacterized repeat protein (TIGR01451 family)